MGEVSPGHRPKRNKVKRGNRRRKPNDPAKTGRALRQQFNAPTVEELSAGISRMRALSPMNGPNVIGTNEVHPVYREILTKFEDKDVDSVFDAVRHSEVVPFAEDRISAAKKKAGRPTVLSYRALLVGMLLTAIDGKGALCSEVAKTLYRRLHPSAMRLLDLTPLPEARTTAEERKQQWMTEKRVRDCLHRLLRVVDPSIHPKGTSMTWEELRKYDRDLSPEEIEERQQALSIVCNSILQTPYNLLPASVKRKYRGSACIDATPLRIYSRGSGVDTEVASTDPDAAYYQRGGDHTEEDAATKSFFAFDINLMVAVCDHLGLRQYLPALPLAMHLDRPGVDPSGASRRMMGYLETCGFQPRYLAGDGLYANADPRAFHNEARRVGWKLVLPILDGHLGVQTTMEGLLMVEGHWYCPSIPATLIDATKTFRAGFIDWKTYQQKIAQREMYRARFKGTNGSGSERWGCPASGSHPAVMCALKPRSEEKKFTHGKLKERVLPDTATQTNGVWPKPCRQESVTIALGMPAIREEAEDAQDPKSEDDPATLADRYLQDLTFGTVEHTATYNVLRQSQEGLHGFAKDDAYEALGTPGKRRVRGLAAQSLFAALLLAAAGIRKIRIFLRNAKRDENGDWYVPRKPRKGEHATTNLPPGTKGTRGDPDFDNEEAA